MLDARSFMLSLDCFSNTDPTAKHCYCRECDFIDIWRCVSLRKSQLFLLTLCWNFEVAPFHVPGQRLWFLAVFSPPCSALGVVIRYYRCGTFPWRKSLVYKTWNCCQLYKNIQKFILLTLVQGYMICMAAGTPMLFRKCF